MLYDKLKKYSESGIYPMHMPGHKRNIGILPHGLPYDTDVSEISGFDNLHDPRSVLRESAEVATGLYGSDKAFMLINGSTVGILAAIGAHAGNGDKILMARNCHLSVYNAVELFGLDPVYIVPETDESTGIFCSVDPAAVESALESGTGIKLVVVTSPTYEGVVSDIGSIAAIAHKYDVPLLVDEAHGAHLGFSKRFPENAVRAGADITVMSLHKTLPALTQCALMHQCGKYANVGEISRMLSILQTSSPSYILMASIDHCLRFLESDKDKLFADYEQNLDQFDREAKTLKNLSVLCKGGDVLHPGFFMFDPGKIVISTKSNAINGLRLADIFREEYKIELEMACADYAIAMTSICDTSYGFMRLADALKAIDSSAQTISSDESAYCEPARRPSLPDRADMPGDAIKRHGGFVPIKKSEGFISLEYVWVYPPGIPIITPGEIISPEFIVYIDRLVRSGVTPKSTKSQMPGFIYATSNALCGTQEVRSQ